MKEITTQNNFDALSNSEEQVPSVFEEGEVPHSLDEIQEENKESTETNIGSPTDRQSPTYAEMAKKRNLWIHLALLKKIL